MRIALVMSHADRVMTGATRELHFCKGLNEHGCETRVFRMHGGPEIEEEYYLSGAVRVTFCPPDVSGPIPHKLTSRPMLDQIKNFRPDLIIYKGLSYRINQFLQDRVGKVPYGFIVGGSVTDVLLDGASFVFGEYDQQLETHFSAFVQNGTAFVLPKYIALDLCLKDEGATKLYDIINVGNFYEKRKNQKDLLPLSDRYSIALVGGGRPPGDFMEAAPQPANVHLLGRLAHSEVFHALHQSKIMVHTSTMDGLPRSVVEAMACGLPVVAYRSTVYGGFVDGQHGFMTDPENLRDTVSKLLEHEDLRLAFSANARDYATRHHGTAAIENAAERFVGFARGRIVKAGRVTQASGAES